MSEWRQVDWLVLMRTLENVNISVFKSPQSSHRNRKPPFCWTAAFASGVGGSKMKWPVAPWLTFSLKCNIQTKKKKILLPRVCWKCFSLADWTSNVKPFSTVQIKWLSLCMRGKPSFDLMFVAPRTLQSSCGLSADELSGGWGQEPKHCMLTNFPKNTYLSYWKSGGWTEVCCWLHPFPCLTLKPALKKYIYFLAHRKEAAGEFKAFHYFRTDLFF